MIHAETHTRENLYAFEHCDKSFTTQGWLNQHIRFHTGERDHMLVNIVVSHCDDSWVSGFPSASCFLSDVLLVYSIYQYSGK